MKYYHEFDIEKDSPLHPECRCGYFIGEEWVNEDDLTEEQELLVEEMDLLLEEGYFLCDTHFLWRCLWSLPLRCKKRCF